MEYGSCADFAHEFFSRVPSFVWKNLQIPRLPSAGCLRFSKWLGPSRSSIGLLAKEAVVQSPSDRHSRAIGQVQI